MFGCDSLAPPTFWRYIATLRGASRLTRAEVATDGSLYFLHAARGDVDSDGDGLSDWLKIYRYGLDPLVRDTDGDGFDDDEELAAGSNPLVGTDGAAGTYRYFFDDDNLTGSYFGVSQGATTKVLSCAGNPAAIHQRKAAQ